MSLSIEHGLPFYAITPWVVLYAVFSLVVHRLQYPSAHDQFFEGLLLAECVAGTKAIPRQRNAIVVIVSVVADSLCSSFYGPYYPVSVHGYCGMSSTF
jgi:hypothetical protein